ncbi:M16 family metallopeptidase [Oceaniglobus ichthyenteri]|uniref:M16 family metallopeptidase n=1 Tax=Oceaniglobus ichthyenteri TaxID=2136177 RepID=UPI000D3A647B|nr:pitrilysin family protein [Oceaniglobus ichthyenteri]
MIRFAFILAAAVMVSLPARAAVEIQEVTSPGGITAWLVQEDSIPFTALEIRFKGGANVEAPDKRGAVNLMMATLEEGAADLNAQEFAAAREALAASFGFEAWNDSVSISARFLSENRDAAMALLRTAIIDPTFEQSAIDRVREQVLSGLRSDATDPGTIASKTMARLAWGDHPYGSDASGTIETVTALTRDDIVQARRDVLVRDRMFVGAVGDITPEELGVLLDRLLSDLPEEGAPLPVEAQYQQGGGLTVVPFDTPQSVIVFGHDGIDRDDPEFFPAFVANHIFGAGGFSSRLMTEVREKRGLTYGIGTYLATYDFGEAVMGQASTENARVGETVDVVRAEWAKIAQGVTADELEAAKTFLTGAYPLRFDGNGQIAGQLVGMQAQGLPIDYIDTRNDKVNAVTLDDVNQVVKRVYRPEDLHFVIVGQPVGVEPTN